MRIRIQPDEVRTAAFAFSTAYDDVAQAATAVAGVAIPTMPAPMAARYQDALAGIATRLSQTAGEFVRLSDELQVRATAAELADAPTGTGPTTVHALARALEQTSTSTSLASVPGLVVAVAGSQLTITTGSGTHIAIATQDLGLPATAVTDLAAGTDTQAPPPRTGAPKGGLAAAAVHDALTAPLAGHETASIHASAGATDMGDRLRAVCQHDGGAAPAVVEQPPAHSLDRQSWGCWMAGQAAAAGLPPTLPLMAALARSGLRNMPAGDGGAGFFGINAGAAYAPPGHGLTRNAQPDAGWWSERPDAQLDYMLRRFHDTGGGSRSAALDDPDALARWAAEATGGHASGAAALADAHTGAGALVAHCGSAQSPAGGAIAAARTQLGVHEAGINAGPAVDRYLAAAGAPSGNPWCAGFVTWSVEQTGHALPGGGWAAVDHWVAAAQAGQDGLSIVDAADARPGDVVAFDWGGGGDFGADGHIGFLDSPVGADGAFATIEGNAGDAVAQIHRSVSDGNVLFIRVDA